MECSRHAVHSVIAHSQPDDAFLAFTTRATVFWGGGEKWLYVFLNQDIVQNCALFVIFDLHFLTLYLYTSVHNMS